MRAVQDTTSGWMELPSMLSKRATARRHSPPVAHAEMAAAYA